MWPVWRKAVRPSCGLTCEARPAGGDRNSDLEDDEKLGAPLHYTVHVVVIVEDQTETGAAALICLHDEHRNCLNHLFTFCLIVLQCLNSLTVRNKLPSD